MFFPTKIYRSPKSKEGTNQINESKTHFVSYIVRKMIQPVRGLGVLRTLAFNIQFKSGILIAFVSCCVGTRSGLRQVFQKIIFILPQAFLVSVCFGLLSCSRTCFLLKCVHRQMPHFPLE